MRITVFNDIDRSLLREKIPGFKEVDITDSPNAIILRSEDLHKKELPASLAVICRAGSGVDNIPKDWCSKNGVVVMNTRGANANAVKEWVLGALAVTGHRMIEALKFLEQNPDLVLDRSALEREKKRFRGQEMKGRQILLVGLGAVGTEVAKMCKFLEMGVWGYDPYLTDKDFAELSIKRLPKLNEEIRNFDYISFHCSLNEETRGMINNEFLEKTKPGVIIINSVRGELAEERALFDAMRVGHMGAYMCDLPTPLDVELLRASVNQCWPVFFTPHLAGTTSEAGKKVITMAGEQVKDFWAKGHIKNSVNFQSVSRPRAGPFRLTVSNFNVPGMLGKIESVIGDLNYNIAGSIHETKKSVGYSIVDIDNPDEDMSPLVNKIKKIEGVTRVRAFVF